MESELNKTPVKSEFDYDYDYDSPVGTFSKKSSSPSYVKWDFITPAFSDKVKNAALKLKSEVRRERLRQIRNFRRGLQNSMLTSTKSKNESPVDKSFYTTVNQLRKTVDQILDGIGKTVLKPDPSKDISSCTIKVKNDHTDLLFDDTNDDLFNDSANDLFAECSQSIEDTYYNKPKKKLFHKEQYISDETANTSISGFNQLISEKDDDLFWKVDLNNLVKF